MRLTCQVISKNEPVGIFGYIHHGFHNGNNIISICLMPGKDKLIKTPHAISI
jgi:hypothetical protein